MTLSISVKELPEPYANENPVGVQTSPPELQIPWIDDEHLPDGLKPKENWQRWLAPLQSRGGGGFAINNIGSNSVFSFFEDRRMAFMPESQNIRMPDKSGKMTGYRRFQFKRTFIAKNVDQYTFRAGLAERDLRRGNQCIRQHRAKTSTPWPRP